jgi:hypothetical protein
VGLVRVVGSDTISCSQSTCVSLRHTRAVPTPRRLANRVPARLPALGLTAATRPFSRPPGVPRGWGRGRCGRSSTPGS